MTPQWPKYDETVQTDTWTVVETIHDGEYCAWGFCTADPCDCDCDGLMIYSGHVPPGWSPHLHPRLATLAGHITENRIMTDTTTTTTTTRTRPARPGDVIWRAAARCGAKAHVYVGEPPAHPSFGVHDVSAVRLVGVLEVPTCEDLASSMAPSLCDGETIILGCRAHSGWGWAQGDSSRIVEVDLCGDAIGPVLTALRVQLAGALEAFDSIDAGHRASVERLASARRAAYAAWPVATERASFD